MELKDSKTKTNLMRAFAGEGQARNRYNIAAGIAKSEGHPVIQDVFNYTAEQERAHAKVFYQHLAQFSGQSIIIDQAGYPVDMAKTTIEQLKMAQHNEFEEWQEVYASFANTAREEGFEPIAQAFELIARVENAHGTRFGELAQELEEGTLYKKAEPVQWMCTVCGNMHEGTEPPKVCPVCHHPQGFFIVFAQSCYESDETIKKIAALKQKS